jgi:hypothetical protein
MADSDPQSSYLVECYWPGVSEEKHSQAASRARAAAAELRNKGGRVDFLSSILVPVDETIFYLFEGRESDVRAVSEQTGGPIDRVLATRRIDGGAGQPPHEPVRPR